MRSFLATPFFLLGLIFGVISGIISGKPTIMIVIDEDFEDEDS